MIPLLFICRFLLGAFQGPCFQPLQGRYSKMVSFWFLGITQWNDFNGFGTWFCLNAPNNCFLAEYFGWQSTFLISILGVIGTIVWWKYSKNWPNEHPDINQAELELIGEPDFNNNQMTWPMVKEVLKNKNILFTALGYMSMNYVFFIFYSWIFIYFVNIRGLMS